MARAPKSVEVYMAYERARQSILNHRGPLPSVPLHLRNAPTKLMKSLGYGKGYKYNPAFGEPVEQQYMPDGLEGLDFFTKQWFFFSNWRSAMLLSAETLLPHFFPFFIVLPSLINTPDITIDNHQIQILVKYFSLTNLHVCICIIMLVNSISNTKK